MLRIVLIAALVYSASAGLIAGPAVLSAPVSFASGPALGAPLLGTVTQNAPEVTVVKQPVTVDQHVTQYRAVPQVIQPHVVVQHQPTVVATHHVVAQPAVVATRHVVAQPAVLSAQHIVAQPALALAHQNVVVA